MEKRVEWLIHENFKPYGDGVILEGKRVMRHIIMPENDSKGTLYHSLKVVGYGPLTRWVEEGDNIKLSDFSAQFSPEFLWTDEVGDNEIKDKIDYLLVSEAFIKGVWGDKMIDEDEE